MTIEFSLQFDIIFHQPLLIWNKLAFPILLLISAQTLVPVSAPCDFFSVYDWDIVQFLQCTFISTIWEIVSVIVGWIITTYKNVWISRVHKVPGHMVHIWHAVDYCRRKRKRIFVASPLGNSQCRLITSLVAAATVQITVFQAYFWENFIETEAFTRPLRKFSITENRSGLIC